MRTHNRALSHKSYSHLEAWFQPSAERRCGSHRITFVSYSGVYVDRFDRKRLLAGADSVRLALIILVALADDVLLLYALTFLSAVAGAIYRMARIAVVPQLAGRKAELLTINSLLNSAQTLTLALGPAVGGLVVAALGVRFAFALDAATFAMSASSSLNGRCWW